MTHGAAALLTHIRQTSDVPESYGVRVFPQEVGENEVSIGLGFTEQPMEGDQVTEQDGLRLFVAKEIAGPLDSTTIDVAGENGGSQLVFRPQEGDGPSAS